MDTVRTETDSDPQHCLNLWKLFLAFVALSLELRKTDLMYNNSTVGQTNLELL